jgi:hypothetical protein
LESSGEGRKNKPSAQNKCSNLTVRSENLFVEQLHYNLLFRWFLDMDLAGPVFDHSTFSKNQTRLMEHDAAQIFFVQVVALAREQGWVSDEHFSVDTVERPPRGSGLQSGADGQAGWSPPMVSAPG